MSTQREGSILGGVEVGPTRLWFGLLGGAFAWLAHLMIAYTVAEFGCVGSLGKHTALGISVVAWIVLLLSAVTLLIAVVATVAAYQSQSRLITRRQVHHERISDGAIYAARAGWITSGLFTLVILVESLPILYYLQDC